MSGRVLPCAYTINGASEPEEKKKFNKRKDFEKYRYRESTVLRDRKSWIPFSIFCLTDYIGFY